MGTDRRTLSFVILFALGLHLAFFSYLHKHPIALRAHFDHFYSQLDQESFSLLKKRERTEILAQIFDQINEANFALKEDFRELTPEFSPTPSISFPEGEPFLIKDAAFTLERDPLEFSTFDEEEISRILSEPLSSPPPLFVASDIPILVDFIGESAVQEGSDMIAASDLFDLQVEYCQKKDRPGYVFKATLLPKNEVHFKRIQQNYYFLLDRSNSIPRARFTLNKEAISRALDHLKPSDTFNILLFDHKVVKFSETPLLWNTASVEMARDFLEKNGHGGYFAATELYSSLGKIIPENVSDNKVNTAILLSDGDTYLPQDQQRKFIGGWTKSNMGKVSLFAIASGGGNNLPLLDLLSTFNKGALIYSYDHSQLGDKLVELVRTIRNPIGKDIVATALTADKGALILLQPKNERLPDLYQNKPYVIYGSINKMSDFVLFLQGKYYGQRFDVKKRISFEKAKLGPPALEKAWTQLVVQEFYDRYFEDGNKKHIEAARRLLEPLNLPVPLSSK